MVKQTLLIWLSVGAISIISHSITISAYSQKTQIGTISGQVKNKEGKPVDGASIALLGTKDSTMTEDAVTDTGGNYFFTRIPNGSYYVVVASMGFKNASSQPFVISDDQPTIKVPLITIIEDVRALDEVTVTAQKPFIQQMPDRMIINVENSIISKGGTALELLELSPGVMVDPENNRISMRGRDGVLVMIDDKPTYLALPEIINLLRNTPSNSIQSIELITNPSAKYDAAGNSGIINIKLKKDKRLSGTNGSATIGGGYGKTPKFTTGMTLNHRSGDWSLFGNYNFSYRENEVRLNAERLFLGEGDNSKLQTTGLRPMQDRAHIFKAGADYFLDERNVFGIMFNGTISDSYSQLTNDNVLYQGQEILQRTTFENTSGRSLERLAANINYKHTFRPPEKGKGSRQLTVDADYSRVNIRPEDYMTTLNDSETLLQRNIFPSEVRIRAAKLDYIHPLKNAMQFEMGWKTSYVTSDNDVSFEQQENGEWTIDPGRTNHFMYDETIHAAYFMGSKKWKKWSLQIGLRMEVTQSTGNSITEENIVDRSYVDLFPSAFLTRALGKEHQVGISYSRRIDRPKYQDLNPFVYILDPYSDFQGDPFLQPQYTHAIQTTYSYKNKYTLSMGYNVTSDVMEIVRDQDPETNRLRIRPVNFGRFRNINLSIGFPLTLASWWNMRQSADIYFNDYDADYMGRQLEFRKLTASLKMNHNFTLPKGFSAQLSGFYTSPRVAGVLNIKRLWQVSAGVQKMFWNNTATLSLNLSDIFYATRFRGNVNYNNTHVSLYNYADTRVFRMTFTYNFGNQQLKKSGQRRTGVEEEQDRVGSSND